MPACTLREQAMNCQNVYTSTHVQDDDNTAVSICEQTQFNIKTYMLFLDDEKMFPNIFCWAFYFNEQVNTLHL